MKGMPFKLDEQKLLLWIGDNCVNKLGKNLTGRGGQYICDMLDEEKEGSAAQHKIKKKKKIWEMGWERLFGKRSWKSPIGMKRYVYGKMIKC